MSSFDIIDRRISHECIKTICFLLAGASRSPGGTKAPSPELDTENGCGTGLKCDHKCISYDGVPQCVCRHGYQLQMNGYSCVGEIAGQPCCRTLQNGDYKSELSKETFKLSLLLA